MKILSLLFFSVFSFLSFGQMIERIEFEGNKKCKESFLRMQLGCREGDIYDSLKVEQDAQFLRNTNLFFEVTYRLDQANENSIGVTFLLNEVITIFPIFANGGSSEKLNFTLGVSDINFRGKGNTLGLVYQYYDRHSFKIYHIAPRHLNNKTGHELFVGKYSTIEPLYFANQKAFFNFDNYHLSSALYFWLNRFWKINLGGALFYEKYANRDVEVMDYSILPGQQFDFYKYQIRTGGSYKNLEYIYERRKGLWNKLDAESIVTRNYPGATFLKLTNELKTYFVLGKRHNILFRQYSGIATNNNSPFSPFVIDDFVNIRGVGNRIARGTALFTFNTEYLFSVLKTNWFYAQLATFYDLGYQRPPGAKLDESFSAINTYQTAGFGLRLQSRKYYNTVFRFDYGFQLNDLSQGGFVVGLGQYF
jgi:outer membrane protein assembly factor BamA